MAKLLWSFTVKNPVKQNTDLPANDVKTSTTEKRRFGSRFKKNKFQLPECPSQSTVFQVYTTKEEDNGTTDFAQEIYRIAQSNYSVELVAIHYQKDLSDEKKKKIFTTTFQKSSVQYILLDKYNKNEEKMREMAESLNSLLFGLPLAGEPLWLTTSFEESNPDLLVLQIRRGGRRNLNRTVTSKWTPYDAEILGQIPLQKSSALEGDTDTIYNMMYQGTNQLMNMKAQVLQLQSQQKQLMAQIEEFLVLKEVSEAEMLEKMVMLLNKKKEKLEQLKRGVDIPDEDEMALYEFYSQVGEYNMLNGNNICNDEDNEGSINSIIESEKIVSNGTYSEVPIKQEKKENEYTEVTPYGNETTRISNEKLEEKEDKEEEEEEMGDEHESISTRSPQAVDLSDNEDLVGDKNRKEVTLQHFENDVGSSLFLKRKRTAEPNEDDAEDDPIGANDEDDSNKIISDGEDSSTGSETD